MTIANFEGRLIDRSHPEFDKARMGWNGMIEHEPALIAQCSSVADVVAAVRYASTHGLQAAARCGGHSVSGASLPADGVLIDLAGIKEITIDQQRRIASVGGGALLGELDAATQEHGLAVTAGVEPETGAGGLTLGGGIGFLARKLGLTIDNLSGAQVVLADGSVVEANKKDHPDLFWALRGGGGEFGIVTRFDYRLHPIGPKIVSSQAFFPLAKAHDVMRRLRSFMDKASDDITILLVFRRIPATASVPAEWQGMPSIGIVACHVGDEETGRRELQPLIEMGDLISGFVDTIPYLDFQRTFAGTSPSGARFYWKSVFIDDLSDDLTDVLVDGIEYLPGEYSLIFLQSLGGAVSRVKVEDTAFANRTARYNLGISAGWEDSVCDNESIRAVRDVFARLQPFSDGTVYLNYLDRDELGRAKEGFGTNFTRLREIKRRYDPENRFGSIFASAS